MLLHLVQIFWKLLKSGKIMNGALLREMREIGEIVLAAEGAPFRVSEKSSGREFLAQLRPIDDALLRHVDIHNSLDHPGIVQMHRVLRDEKLALVVFEKSQNLRISESVTQRIFVSLFKKTQFQKYSIKTGLHEKLL
ncbi:Protein CBG26591 [Caenorhabditis briggsae]|uniref:Protein CBG26591 n=1 Tax=Caenorhabditis briggsae TaxID=6238 RepID=B6IIF1_CAEBR|nr:Protein CBG26591 [Caenorhabditis briggsae]CAR99681.1 Protein CBG26591 [Caenorhabditis briggsae]